MSLNACESRVSVLFLNRDIHNQATRGADILPGLDALVRKEIPH